MLASNNFRHFLNRLNRDVYRNAARRFGKGLKVIAVLEHDALVRFAFSRPLTSAGLTALLDHLQSIYE